MTTAKDPFKEMQREISKAGGLFYQYRACKRDVNTIYDIENILHGIVYARTPLDMNDPFDSRIGYSPEGLYQESIDYIFQAITIPETIKPFLSCLLKINLLGRLGELFSALNQLRGEILRLQTEFHKTFLPFDKFVSQFIENNYNRCPKSIKEIITKDIYRVGCQLIAMVFPNEINSDTIEELFHTHELLEGYKNKIVELRDKAYLPRLKDFLSRVTISCFSVSGWRNPLMWSHYANAYSGICVEYDFSKITDFVGFIKEVKYSTTRPKISLKDLGIDGLKLVPQGDKNAVELREGEPHTENIMQYMLVKDTCWQYEQEWRILNIENQPYTPTYINLPFIKSITFGPRIDSVCKQLLIDICIQKGIECYELILSDENFSIDRRKIDIENIDYSEEKETQFLNYLSGHIADRAALATEYSNKFVVSVEEGSANIDSLHIALEAMLDFSCDVYFLKRRYHQFLASSDFSEADEEVIASSQRLFKKMGSKLTAVWDIIVGLTEKVNIAYATQRISYSDYKKICKDIDDVSFISKSYMEIT